ncbi:MAG: sensor histidine kinase, partial [Anaerolineae bacterium]
MPPVRDHPENEEGGVETYFAPAARASENMLQQEIEIISQNPVIDTVMDIVGGLVAVLNEQRQILTINKTLLKTLGINEAGEALGLRLGEAIHCIHAHEHPGGCGTTRYCSTCGAAIAMVTSLAQDSIETRECVVTANRNGEYVDLYFQVRCLPVSFREQRFLLLFLQDHTIQQEHAALERAFFHDVNNTIGALLLNIQMLSRQAGEARLSILIRRIQQLAAQLEKEVEIQSVLSHTESSTYQVTHQPVSVREILQEMQEIFTHHPVSTGRTLFCPEMVSDVQLVTDVSLLRRILT